MTQELGTAAQQNMTPLQSRQPDRGDVGLLEGRWEGADAIFGFTEKRKPANPFCWGILC